MSESPLSPATVQARIIELLGEGKGAPTIATRLREEGHADVTISAITQHIHKIVADPKLSALLTLRQRAQVVANASRLHELGWKVLEKIDGALKHVNINDEVLEMKDVKLLAALTPLLHTWWRSMAEINDMLKKEQLNLNLTQVNIEQVSTVNSQLLSVIQDVLNALPADKRTTVMERLAELSSPDVVETEGRVKQ